MKLKKLKLNQQLSKLRSAVVLDDPQMKVVRGGYYGNDYPPYVYCFACDGVLFSIQASDCRDRIFDIFAERCPGGGQIWAC